MNKLFATSLIAAALAFAAGSATAQQYTTPPKGTNTYPAMTPEEMERAKAEKAAGKETKSEMTDAEKKAANAEKQKAMKAQGTSSDSTKPTTTPEQQAKAKADRAAKNRPSQK